MYGTTGITQKTATVTIEKTPILIVSESLEPSPETTYLEALMLGFDDNSLELKLATGRSPAQDCFDRSLLGRFETFPDLTAGWSFVRPFSFRRFSNWARNLKPELIHGASLKTLAVCQRLAALLDLPFLLTVLDYNEEKLIKPGPYCYRIVVPNQTVRTLLVNNAGIPRELISVVPLGLSVAEPEDLALDGPDRVYIGENDARQPARIPLIATVGELTARSGMQEFLKLAVEIRGHLNDRCQFLIVGEGPEESALRKQCAALGLSRHLTFGHRNIPLRRLLFDVEIYVQLSRQEGCGLTVLEAMACGRPVVATSVGGLIALVRDGETGYLVPVEDPAIAAQQVKLLMANPQMRASFGSAARKSVQEKHSLSQMAEETADLYAECMGIRPPTSSTTIVRNLLKS